MTGRGIWFCGLELLASEGCLRRIAISLPFEFPLRLRRGEICWIS